MIPLQNKQETRRIEYRLYAEITADVSN